MNDYNITLEGFTAFCKSQGEQDTDHSTSGPSAWGHCAVGQYYLHLTNGKVLQYPESQEFTEALQLVIGERLYDLLGESEIATYPELVEELTQV